MHNSTFDMVTVFFLYILTSIGPIRVHVGDLWLFLVSYLKHDRIC